MSDGLVYSTETGQVCPKCSKPIKECSCKSDKKNLVNSSDGVVRVGKETKGRKGKGVTVISGIEMNEIELKFLAKELKQKCGTGGTCKNGIIEIQGDQRDLLVGLLIEKGFRAKRVGG
jgi:translation initiation factor 1